MKSTLVKRKIGEKVYNITTPTPVKETKKVVRTPKYRTNGENLIIVKDTDYCELSIDSTNTNTIKIKAMTKVLIIPTNSTIDDYYEEILIEKGACVELEFIENSWYILSSDGLKLN